MAFDSILLWIFSVGVSVGLIYAGASLIGANIYDIASIRRQARYKRHPYSKVLRYRPFISIVIPVHNEEQVIERCIRSILKNSYRKFEIIVGDDASTDKTSQIVRRLKREFPKRRIVLTWRRTNGGRGAAIDAGIKKASGELIMALDADCTLDKFAIRNAVRHFADSSTAAVAMNVRVMQSDTTISLLQTFDYIVSFRNKKFNTLTNSEHIIGGAGATYRKDVIKKLGGFNHSMKTEDIEMSLRIAKQLGSREFKLRYASDVLVHTEPVPSYKSLFRQRFRWKFGSLQALYLHKRLLFSFDKRHSHLLSWLRLPFAIWSEMLLLLEPLFFSYFIYLAVHNQNATLFGIACLTVTALILMAIWSDEHLSFKNRMALSMYSPMMYLVFYLLTIIQVLAMLRCVVQIRGIVGKKRISGAYISPERAGAT